MWINQKTGETPANAGTGGLSGTCVGRYNTGIDYWPGTIAELAVFKGALSNSNTNLVLGYLASRYRVSLGS
jgi:hypothetical protein